MSDFVTKYCECCQEEYQLPEDCDVCPICGEGVVDFDDWYTSQEEPIATQ